MQIYKVYNVPKKLIITINTRPEIILNAIKQNLVKIYFIKKTQDIMDYFLARALASAKN